MHRSLDWSTSIVNLNFPKLRFVGDTALCYLTKLKVVFLDSVIDLQPWAFVHCGGIRFVQMNSVTVIPSHCFRNC